MFTELEQRFKTYDSNKSAVAAMTTEVAELKSKLEAARKDTKGKQGEIERLAQRVKEADEMAEGQAGEMKRMGAECEAQKVTIDRGVAELNACRGKLNVARANLGDGTLRDYDSDGLRKL